MTEPPFPPITISFHWQEDDGEIVGLRTEVSDGVDVEPWWTIGMGMNPDAFPELLAAYKRRAAEGAIRNWSQRRSGK
jgi:hypothetical protein